MKIDKDYKKRVVITGLGVVSPIGIGWNEFFLSIQKKIMGYAPIKTIDTSNYIRKIGCEVNDNIFHKHLIQTQNNKFNRATKLALIASKLAIMDANFNNINFGDVKFCFYNGSTLGSFYSIENINKMPHIRYAPLINGLIINNLKLRKFKKISINNINTACSSGAYAIAKAFYDIKTGKFDIGLAGGVDAFSRIAFTGFCRLKNYAKDVCKPYSKDRTGLILGEAAGFVIIETLESALKRKANIYCEILDAFYSCDGFHMTIPNHKGIIRLINTKLKIDHFSLHGTGTIENDYNELKILSNKYKHKLKKIHLFSLKSYIGHSLGAASALEIILLSLCLKNNYYPKTLNINELDDEFNDLINLNNFNEKFNNINTAFKIATAFGGNNIGIYFQKFKE